MLPHLSGLQALRGAVAIVLLASALLLPAVGLAEDPVPGAGIILTRTGEVFAHLGDGPRPAVEGLVLRTGDTIVVRTGGRCTGFAPSGEPFELAGPAQLVFEGIVDRGPLDSIAAWIRRQILQWTGGSTRRPLVTRTARDWEVGLPNPAPLVPAPDGQTRPGKARLFWTTNPGIERYLVTIAPVAGEESRHTVRNSRLELGDLVPGERYVWKVEPDIEGWQGESGWRGFRVLTRDEEVDLDRSLRGRDDLERGVLLLSAGLHEEAIYHLDAAVSAGGATRSALVWRSQALAESGLHRQAYEDMMQVLEIR